MARSVSVAAGIVKRPRLWSALIKAAAIFSGYRGAPYWGLSGGLPGERQYQFEVGEGDGNSIVSACVQWIARTFPEAPPALWRLDDAGIKTRILPTEPGGAGRLLQLLRFPNPDAAMPRGYYSGIALWMATLTSRVVDGNGYWLKVRGLHGAVKQLWYAPHWMMEPRWPADGSVFVSHYDYRVNGQTIQIPARDVVHFRHGLDPDNIRKGRSPLHGVLREVFTDEEAARFSASLLKNLGVPGLVVSPAAGTSIALRGTEGSAEQIKGKFMERFGGDRRGEPLVLTLPTDVKQFGFSPQELDLSALRNVPEERITAAIGLPAAVVGLGVGLQMTKVGATMAELKDLAWTSNLIPTQREMGEEIGAQLLPDFGLDRPDMEFGFDRSGVAVLQEDQGKAAERWASLVRAGIAKRAEARAYFGLPIAPEDDVYLPQPGVGGSHTPEPPQNGQNGNLPAGDTQPHQLPEAQPA